MNNYPDLIKLLKLINLWQLTEVAKRESRYAYDTAIRIIDTGHDLDPDLVSLERFSRDDTALTAWVLSNPRNWGVGDIEWEKMATSWLEHRATVL